VPRIVALFLVACTLAGAISCKRAAASRGNTALPVLPPGFVEQSGSGWRLAVPSAWQRAEDTPKGAWAFVDPQPVNDYRANVNVVTEPFAGQSRDYARAGEALLRRQSGANVEATRDDVVDGDSTVIVESRWTPRPPSAVEYRTMQAHLASLGTGYVVTCSVSTGAFERYRSTCETIVRSFAVER
jgi:hypothetical protein